VRESRKEEEEKTRGGGAGRQATGDSDLCEDLCEDNVEDYSSEKYRPLW